MFPCALTKVSNGLDGEIERAARELLDAARFDRQHIAPGRQSGDDESTPSSAVVVCVVPRSASVMVTEA
jgi:hypothetical protein